jgi:hypothetical protein
MVFVCTKDRNKNKVGSKECLVVIMGEDEYLELCDMYGRGVCVWSVSW